MEKSLNILGLTLKSDVTEQRHKTMPKHLSSVAEGTVKRAEEKSKLRKTCRLTAFDAGRNLCMSPAVNLDEVTLKRETRHQRLRHWKEEKEKERKKQALAKKKPFVAGVYRAPIQFEPPPPFKATRSQAKKPQIKFCRELNMFNIKDKKKTENIFTFGKTTTAAKSPSSTGSTTSSSTSTIVKESKGTNKAGASKNIAKDAKINKANTKSTLKAAISAKDKKTSTNKGTKKDEDNNNKVKNVRAQNKSVPVKNKNEPIGNKNEQIRNKNEQFRNKNEQVGNKNMQAGKRNGQISIKKDLKRNEVVVNNKREQNKNKNEKLNIIKEKENEDPLKNLQLESSVIDEILIDCNLSPNVTMSRGKEQVRKENKQKLKDGLLAEDATDGQSVVHYRRQHASEVLRITQLCAHWSDILEKEVLPLFIKEKIYAAVGLARLFMSEKLQQFKSLVEKCACPEPNTPLITSADLRGFWDLVFIQIEDIDMKFKELDKYRNCNWVEDEPVKAQQSRKVFKKKTVVKPQAKSKLKDFIAAARKGQKAPEVDEEVKTFDAGYFQIQSPLKVSPSSTTPKSTTPITPKHSLLRAVVSSEAKKLSAKKNSYAMMNASLIGKQVEAENQSPLKTPTQLPLIDLKATPARSILKSKTQKSKRKTPKKSIKTVLFSDEDSAQAEKENQTPNPRVKIQRQHAFDFSPKTRSQRKSSGFIIEDMFSPVVRRSRRLSLKYE